jgi:hypothetical protein
MLVFILSTRNIYIYTHTHALVRFAEKYIYFDKIELLYYCNNSSLMIPDESPIKFLLGVNPQKLPFYHGSFVKNWTVVLSKTDSCVETPLLL